jgi:hypothetical protein
LYEIITRSTFIKNKQRVIKNNIKPFPPEPSAAAAAPPIIFFIAAPPFCELNIKCSTKDPNMFSYTISKKKYFIVILHEY